MSANYLYASLNLDEMSEVPHAKSCRVLETNDVLQFTFKYAMNQTDEVDITLPIYLNLENRHPTNPPALTSENNSPKSRWRHFLESFMSAVGSVLTQSVFVQPFYDLFNLSTLIFRNKITKKLNEIEQDLLDLKRESIYPKERSVVKKMDALTKGLNGFLLHRILKGTLLFRLYHLRGEFFFKNEMAHSAIDCFKQALQYASSPDEKVAALRSLANTYAQEGQRNNNFSACFAKLPHDAPALQQLYESKLQELNGCVEHLKKLDFARATKASDQIDLEAFTQEYFPKLLLLRLQIYTVLCFMRDVALTGVNRNSNTLRSADQFFGSAAQVILQYFPEKCGDMATSQQALTQFMTKMNIHDAASVVSIEQVPQFTQNRTPPAKHAPRNSSEEHTTTKDTPHSAPTLDYFI